MSDPVEPLVEDIPTPDAPVPEPLEPVVPDAPKEEHESRPSFVDEILNHIDSVAATLKADAPPSLDPVVEPVHESPVRKPWTHRGMFGKGN